MSNPVTLLILLSCFCLLLMAIRFYKASLSKEIYSPSLEKPCQETIVAILPFRNEAETIGNTLPILIDEASLDGNCRLILVDSDSNDHGSSLAEDILVDSVLKNEMWNIISVNEPGKCKALNAAMQLVGNDEFVVIVDADAKISNGSFEIFRNWMADSEIGAVSAQEAVSAEHPMGEYKRRSNILRKYESTIGSCIVLEGSLLAWHPYRIGWEYFDELSNADDAQISLSAIRSGHRSIVDPSIVYHDTRKENRGFLKRSIRRSQGLSKQLIKNSDLLFVPEFYSIRGTMFFNILLHLIIPWCILFLLFSPLLIISNGYQPIVFSFLEIISILPSIILLTSLLSRVGRSLIKGSIASVVGQFRLMLKIRSHQWEPGGG